MKKLTEKQANLLSAIISEGGWMSRKHIATYYGVSVAGALVKKGLLELTDTRNYKVMIDAARAALDAYDAEAFAQPVSVATDAAPVWTPTPVCAGCQNARATDGDLCANCAQIQRRAEQEAIERGWVSAPDAAQTAAAEAVTERRGAERAFGGAQNIKAGDRVRIKSGCDFSDHAEQEDLETLRDYNIVGIAVHDAAPPFALSVDFGKAFGRFSMGLNQIVQTPTDPRDEQIAALTRELEAAKAEADETVTFAEYQDKRREIYELTHERDYLQREYDAVRQAFDGYMKANAEREDATDDLQQYRGWINDLIDGLDHISPIEALTRLLAFRRTYGAYTARNEAQTDAALVAARQRADDGARLTTADVIAQAEFAEED